METQEKNKNEKRGGISQFLSDLKTLLTDDFLGMFIIASIIIAAITYTPWGIYKLIMLLKTFLANNLGVVMLIYIIAIYVVFMYPHKVMIKKIPIRINTIVAVIVSTVLLPLCVSYPLLIPLLGLLLSLTYVKNEYVDVCIKDL